ncbi:hypothetical protein C7293_28370 [filamentous cyanobacterium CCT1]|nr:hypothetical protein C7293_28370 [filamentous cyanobacterium CCT1]
MFALAGGTPMDIGTYLISLGVVAIAGFTRGFSGFGSGLILAPALSLLFNPQLVVATILLIDMTAGAGVVPGAVRKTKWQQVLPLVVSAVVMVPVGAHFLALLDPTLLRRIIGGLILGVLLPLLCASPPGLERWGGCLEWFFDWPGRHRRPPHRALPDV